MAISTISKPSTRERNRMYAGTLMKYLVLSSETNRAVSVIETTTLAGAEPPRHVHENEDEIFIGKDGEAVFFIGNDIKHAKAGDVIFAPRGVLHHFKLTTPRAKAILILTPGQLEQFFWELSVPFEGNEPPDLEGPPLQDMVAAINWLSERYGIKYV